MSRHEINVREHFKDNKENDYDTFAYGYEFPSPFTPGTYFWQMFDVDAEPSIEEGDTSPRTGGQFLEAISTLGITNMIPEEHRFAAAMDMPIPD